MICANENGKRHTTLKHKAGLACLVCLTWLIINKREENFTCKNFNILFRLLKTWKLFIKWG